MKKVILTGVLMLCTALLFAQGSDTETLTLKLYFRQNRVNLDTTYMDNGKRMKEFTDRYSWMKNDPELVYSIGKVSIRGGASPEGQPDLNQWLSEERGKRMVEFISSCIDVPEGNITVDAVGVDWAAVADKVEEDHNLSGWEEIVDILRNCPRFITKGGKIVDGLRKRFMEHKGGKSYNTLLETVFPYARTCSVAIEVTSNARELQRRRAEEEAARQTEAAAAETAAAEAESERLAAEQSAKAAEDASALAAAEEAAAAAAALASQKEKDRVTIFALKTNLLYDAVTALNAELEIPIGRHFSIDVEDVFPWWHQGNKRALEMWEMGAEARYWFKTEAADKKLRGHFLGVYGMSSKYDFQNISKLCYQGTYWSAGLTYGYSLPLGKKQKVNMEFSISAGYLQSAYQHYWPATDFSMLIKDPNKAGTVKYFGPTKLKVSLVVPVNVTYTKKKGGEE